MITVLTKNKIKLTPEIKTKVNQITVINNVWPISGWAETNKTTGKSINMLRRYLK